MGCMPKKTCGVYGTFCNRFSKTVKKTVIINNNVQPIAPNPINFNIIKHTQVNGHVIAKIHYPDCTNYEGMKICLFVNTDIERLLKQRSLDPHFSKKGFSPFARFKPDRNGWNAAVVLAKAIPHK